MNHNAKAVETANGVFTAQCPCGWEGVKSWKKSVVDSNAHAHNASEAAKAATA
jgi:hypothetical protein